MTHDDVWGNILGLELTGGAMKNFTEVMDDELVLINGQIGKGQGSNKLKGNLTGLAFSGGGIRSATFNLGIIQSIAGKKLLDNFDYLSTVSGGGYIGAWLSAQICRNSSAADAPSGQQKVEDFQQVLNAAQESGNEHDAVKWLRSYSNYLTPRKGLSGDTLAAIGTWLRNTSLNQITLFLFFASLLLLPQVITLLSSRDTGWITPRLLWLLLSIALTFGAILLCALQLPKLRYCTSIYCASLPKQKTIKFTLLIIPVAVLAAYSLSMWMYLTSLLPNLWMTDGEQSSSLSVGLFRKVLNELPLISSEEQIASPMLSAIEAYWSPVFISVVWAVIYAFPWMLAMLYTLVIPKSKRCKVCTQDREGNARQATEEPFHSAEQATASPLRFALGAILCALAAGAFGGWLIYLLSHVVAQQNGDIRLWWATGFGAPLLLVIFCLILMLHQGLMARLFRVSQLEWWARLGGYLLLVAAIWAGVHALLLYVPPLLNMLQSQFIAAGGIVWAAHSLAGIIFGKGADTSGTRNSAWKEWISRAAPYMFVLGYLVATAWAVHALIHKLGAEGTPHQLNYLVPDGQETSPFGTYLAHALLINNHADQVALGYTLVAGCIAFLILAWRLDVNLFSIHHFYRNRLTRCYLGAGRGRNRIPDLFTGFDPCDDIKLADLKQRPLHLVNTALNLVNDGDLAWQDRKAYSFTFSPIACGFEYPPNANKPGGGYCDSAQYMGSVRLGTAMAASGAAASPNMGYHSSPAVAFLLTIFNVRLGHWCPNPAARIRWGSSIERNSPLMGGEYLLKELFGQTDDRNAFVYLSDGGHFENLGVYELVRRRCRYIMVVDAGQDEMRTFEDAGNLIRKCCIDFGVTININLDALRVDSGISTGCFALGDIVYPPLSEDKNTKGGASRGVLLYIKPSLIKDLPEDIRQYTKTSAVFPHQTTADQFFDEAQFESYRHLGKFLMDAVIDSVAQQKTPEGQSWSWDQ
jgi:Patatin-like phospholipase